MVWQIHIKTNNYGKPDHDHIVIPNTNIEHENPTNMVIIYFSILNFWELLYDYMLL